MAGWNVTWNAGQTVAAVLLVAGGGCVIASDGLGDPLHTVGVGILVASAVVYLLARVWSVTRGRRK